MKGNSYGTIFYLSSWIFLCILIGGLFRSQNFGIKPLPIKASTGRRDLNVFEGSFQSTILDKHGNDPLEAPKRALFETPEDNRRRTEPVNLWQENAGPHKAQTVLHQSSSWTSRTNISDTTYQQEMPTSQQNDDSSSLTVNHLPISNSDDTATVSNTVSYFGKMVPFRNCNIVYNAVPKCGSRTIQVAVISLPGENGKGHRIKNSPQPTECIQLAKMNHSCLSDIYHSMKGSSFIRIHVPFIEMPRRRVFECNEHELSRHMLLLALPTGRVDIICNRCSKRLHNLASNSTNYVMINMVRDPIERWISKYYFQLYGDGRNRMNISGWKTETFDECFAQRRRHCDPLIDPGAMSFFCGVDARCRTLSRWTLNKAIENLSRYLVVGYLEDIDSMFIALERLLPNMLAGVRQQYLWTKKDYTSKFRTKQKPQVSDETMKLLRQDLSLHYEFYNTVKARFDALKYNLGIGK